ncbi:hypothetical protein CWB60_11115 [Pseudoalteromonas sp. S327]|uniref:HNH endonuclease n=1 Tax=Pseudoalteromonas TaxID=53246 RepID=UPI00110C18DE|nr:MULTISPECIES: HNH endonuclease signature motif containing protein [unclassified Pseudoalteromonas]TMO06126.1 hypothetical protein CWB60_11115 [Pseudoalteromonas sp. S327]TMO16354.1 hypothetical protein CWB59_13395 [Pseudoalteromonas sp. S326]
MSKLKGKNKHGLSRYIPKEIKASIRRDAGYGCVFCGCVLVEYEHIEPEFHNALKHTPEKMTILCPMCHDKVTKKIISKQKVWEAKSNPKGLEQGYVNDTLFPNTDTLDFLLGNMRYQNMGIAITLHGKPLFWFEEPEDKGDPCTICCIFYGLDGSPIAYINRNEYIALVGSLDVVSVGTKLKISDKRNGCILDISRIGGEPLHVESLYTQLHDIKLIIKGADSPVLFGNIDVPEDKLGGIGSLTLAGQGLESKAVALGGIPSRKIGDTLITSVYSCLYGTPIRNSSGQHKGWLVNGNLINFNGEQVGVIKDGNAFSLTGEFVSFLKDDKLTFPNDQYEDGEPIYIRPGSRAGWAVKMVPEYDLSHRFFGF